MSIPVEPARFARTLVFGDIHHHTTSVDAIIARLTGTYDCIVFLGDYFDDFSDTPERMQVTCRWLMDSVNQAGRVHLLGNHDLPYFAPGNPQLRCPGWTPEKQRVFDRECARLPRERFALMTQVGPWLLSHAGVHVELAGTRNTSEIVIAASRALADALAARRSPWLGIGPARGGRDHPPGITWLDWFDEFRPVPGLHQIVGHTPSPGVVRGCHLDRDGRIFASAVHAYGHPPIGPRPEPGSDWLSVNWCIDCHHRLAVVATPERLEIVRSQ